MGTIYKYKLEDFTNISCLSEDLGAFYECYEEYQKDNTRSKRFALEQAGEELGFTIKHRRIEGIITPQFADELNEHVGGLMYD